jgi:hypothetical protein
VTARVGRGGASGRHADETTGRGFVNKLVERASRRVWKTVTRRGLGLMVWLPDARRRRYELWLRGKEEYRRLRAADFVVVSHPKSGRTWLRVMLSRYFQLRYGVPDRYILGFDNFHTMDARVPKIFFTHDSYLREYTGHRDSKVDFVDSKLVFLVRKPQDVAVSQFFQWKYRTRPAKKWLRGYPSHGSDISMFDFLMDPSIGLPYIVDYQNRWAEALPLIEQARVVRYEDMRADAATEFRRVVDFIDHPADTTQVKGAVEFASVANTRKLEEGSRFWLSGSRMRPRDPSNPDSFKVRRAVVGGYRDYFDDAQVDEIDRYVRAHLSPVFGYGDGSPPAAGPARSTPGNITSQ